jgi:hypothetical protein
MLLVVRWNMRYGANFLIHVPDPVCIQLLSHFVSSDFVQHLDDSLATCFCQLHQTVGGTCGIELYMPVFYVLVVFWGYNNIFGAKYELFSNKSINSQKICVVHARHARSRRYI